MNAYLRYMKAEARAYESNNVSRMLKLASLKARAYSMYGLTCLYW
jgi:hypothetical protein